MDLLGKVKNIFSRIDDKLPDNWKYYTETGIGLFLFLAAFGALFVPPISYPTGLSYLVTAVYLVPDIRFRLLYRLDVRPPRYSVGIVLVLGLVVGGLLSPHQGSLEEDQAAFSVSSSDLSIVEEKPVKYAVGTAEVENSGLATGNYTAGIARNGNLINHTTATLDPGESTTFNFSLEIQEEGEHDIMFYSSSSDKVREGDGTGFSITETVTLPHYLNSENIKAVVQARSQIPTKDISNITELEVTQAEEGSEIRLVNRPGNIYGVSDLIKTATANSFYATREIFTEFEGVSHVTTVTQTDFTHSNGTVEIRDVLETGLSQEDAAGIDWDNSTSVMRTNYPHWLNLTSSYEIRSDVCESLSSGVECSK